jgi:hypothetical protein
MGAVERRFIRGFADTSMKGDVNSRLRDANGVNTYVQTF